MNPIIDFIDISKQFFGVKALTDVSLSVNSGEVHSIVGENGAGKSTLMNILGGLFPPSAGEVRFQGNAVRLINEQAALQLGIGVVYQELKLCPNLSITENIFLGRELRGKGSRLNWPEMKKKSSDVLSSLGSVLDPDIIVRRLSIAEQQIVEIAKVLSRNVKVLVLDEPTSALTLNESKELFKNIRKLKAEGVAVIYISHRLEEVLELSDRVSVLRDGRFKGTFLRSEIDINSLVKLIAGDKLTDELGHRASSQKRRDNAGPQCLSVRNLSSADGKVKNTSFELNRGEILGFYGIQGAGRTELLESIFGMRKIAGGEIFLNGSPVENKTVAAAIKNGFAMVPEDRRRTGLFPNMNISENINMSNVTDISTGTGWLKKKSMKKISEKYRAEIGIKTRDIYQNIMQLSGGNQQKVIIGRWLAARPSIFLVDELTRGVDVGAKAEIFSVLKKLRDDGLGIILVSSEIQEVIAESDRVLVMRDGQIVKELIGDEITKDNIVENALIG